MRRYFLVASLWSYLNGSSSYDEEALNSLNESFTLTNDSNTLLIPALLGNFIWKKKFSKEIINLLKKTENKNDKIIDLSVKETLLIIPSWLIHDNQDVMVEDLSKIFLLSNVQK